MEHNKGLLPLAISPHQAVIIPVSSDSPLQGAYCNELQAQLSELNCDSVIYSYNETLNKRIKTGEDMKFPIIVIIGDQEVEKKTVNLRHKIKQQRYEIGINDFLSEISNDLKMVI